MFNISKTVYNDIISNTQDVIASFIKDNPLVYAKPTFDKLVIEHAVSILSIQFAPILSDIFTDRLISLKDIEQIVHDALDNHTKSIILPRSINPTTLDTDYIRANKNNSDAMKNHLEMLKATPQPEQRTTEWYEFRQKYLTASNAWKTFSTEASKNQLIYLQCLQDN